MRISDWSSDVCSSDLVRLLKPRRPGDGQAAGTRTSYLNQRLRIDADIVRRRAGGIDDRLRRLQALRDGGLISEEDRKSVVSGKSVSVRVDLGGRRHIKKKKNCTLTQKNTKQAP